MKKFLIVGFAAIMLAACGNEEKTSEPIKETSSNQPEAEKITEETTSKVEEDTSEDQILSEVGQQIKDDGAGTITLDNIAKINKEYETAGLKIKLLDAKVLTVTDVIPEFKENVESVVDVTVGDEFTYLQVTYDLENTTEETVIFNGIETAIPDNGKQIDVSNNDTFFNQNPTSSKIYSKSSVEENVIGIPIDKTITSIRLIPSTVLYDNDDHSVFHPKEIKIEF